MNSIKIFNIKLQIFNLIGKQVLLKLKKLNSKIKEILKIKNILLINHQQFLLEEPFKQAMNNKIIIYKGKIIQLKNNLKNKSKKSIKKSLL